MRNRKSTAIGSTIRIEFHIVDIICWVFFYMTVEVVIVVEGYA